MKHKFIILYLVPLFLLTCTEKDRVWDNPLDPDSNIEFTAPEITSITPIDFDKLSIGWLKVDENYTKIQIERSLIDSNLIQIAEVDTLTSTYIDTGLVFGSTYYYKIRGMADEVEGAYSEVSLATLNLPAPTNLNYTALSDHEIQLTWDYGLLSRIAGDFNNNIYSSDVSNSKSLTSSLKNNREHNTYQLYTESSPFGDTNSELFRSETDSNFEDGFIIQRSESEGIYTVLDTLASGIIEYEDSNLSFGVNYLYRICTYADIHKSAFTSIDSVLTTFPAPTDLSATAISDENISLSWTDNCDFENGYEIWRKMGNESFEIIDSTTASVISYTDSGLSYGQAYSYKVRAFTNLNNSDYTNEESSLMSIPSPDGLIILQFDGAAIINWTDNSSFETGFSIEKSIEAAPFIEIGTVESDINTYTDTDIDAISQYRYRIRAFTENNYSAYSEVSEFSLFTGDILYISPTGSDFTGNGSANYPYKTIQKGIDVAADSSLVLVAEGTYNESIDYSLKRLIIASYFWMDLDTSHISATTISSVVGRVVNLNTNGSELLGMTITSGEDDTGSGIYASDSVTVANCIITGNNALNTGKGSGIYFSDNAVASVSDCSITNNSITGGQSQGGGVYCGNNTKIDFTDCTITGNTITGDTSHGAGIYAEESSLITLSNCVVNENAIEGESAAGAGVFTVGTTLDVSDCDISENTVTAEFSDGGGLGFTLTFTNCGQTGRVGPSQGACNSEYAGTALEGQVNLSGGIQEWTVPYTGTYPIETWGAQGGSYSNIMGGEGARMRGTFELTAGTVLKILVGQQGIGGQSSQGGSHYCSGGGGGTFVVQSDDTFLIASGGGGGGYQYSSSNHTGGDGVTSTSGTSGGLGGSSFYGYNGGSGGSGGFCNASGCSAGYSGNGNFDAYSFLDGGLGGNMDPSWGEYLLVGGFGGGGGAGLSSGGGGGYSGGGGGDWSTYGSGGGGGSYNVGTNTDNSSGVNTGHGQVVITTENFPTQGVGIYASADLTIDNSTINNNEIILVGSRGGPYGGGVFATGSLNMTNSETNNNGADGVYCTSSGAIYSNINALGNGSYGIYSGGSATFTNCTATGNGADGLYDESGTSTFNNCVASSNTGGGIYSGGDGSFTDCTASSNASGRGIWCDGSGDFISCTTNNNFNDGIYASQGSDFFDCISGSNGGDGLYAGGNSTFSGCLATGNDGGMLASGTGDFSFCSATYNTGNYGLYCGSTGTFFGCTSSNNATGISAGSGASMVDGCNIQNNSGAGVSIGGSGTFNNLIISGNDGTGIGVDSNSTFSDCALSNNAGNGISIIHGTSYLTDITVSNSSMGRGIYNGGTGEFVNVTVSGSSSDGIKTGASTSLTNCISTDNGGYGIWVQNAAFLTNCTADNNATGFYIGAYSSEVINCLSTNNSTYGMELLNSSTLIQNCTISDNNTGVFAGGTSGPAFMNVILYDNITELDGESGSTYTIDYSDVKGGSTFGAWATGADNIDADPSFESSNDYHLQNGSPCINSGNPNVQYYDSDDTRNDMGMYGGPNGVQE